MTLTMPLAALLGAASFLAGLGAGGVYCELRRRSLHTVRMTGPGDHHWRLPHRPTFRMIVLILLTVSLLINATAGVGLIVQRETAKHQAHALASQARQLTRLTRCNATYNEALGNALQERDNRASASTTANIAWLRNFRDQLVHPQTDPVAARARFSASLDTYIAALTGVQHGRIANGYPNPAECRNLASKTDDQVGAR